MEEIWKDIAGFEGLYRISSRGNVKSVNYKNTKTERILTPKKNNAGYLWVELRKNGKASCMLIHRLVAMAYIPNKYNLPQVNHRDENPRNNCVENLEWCTPSQNVQYSINLHPERTRGRERTRKPYKHLRSVVQKNLDGTVVRTYPCTADVTFEHKYNQWSIIQCCNGKRKKAYGYKWEFAD